MKFEFDAKEFGYAIKGKRIVCETNLRTAAKEAGVSAGSISRAERFQEIEIPTFLRLCAWLEIPPAEFFKCNEKA